MSMESPTTSEVSNTIKEGRCATGVRYAVPELLEDAGNCRQSIHQVLEHHPLGNSLVGEQRKLRIALDWAHRFLSSGSEVHPEICRTDSLETDEMKTDNKKTEEFQTGHVLRTSQGHTYKQRHRTNLSDGKQTFTFDAASCSTTGASSCWSDASKKSTAAVGHMETQQGSKRSGDTMSMKKRKLPDKCKETEQKKEDAGMEGSGLKVCTEPSSACVEHTSDSQGWGGPAEEHERKTKPHNPSSTHRLKIPTNVSVYEQYQLYVEQLQQLRLKQQNEKDPGKETTAHGERKTNSSSTNPKTEKHTNTEQNQQLSAAGITENKTTDACDQTAPPMHEEVEPCDHPTSAGLGQQVGVKGQKRRDEARGQNKTHGGIEGVLPRQQMRPQSAAANEHTRSPNTHTQVHRHTQEAKATHASPRQPTKTHTPPPQPADGAVGEWLMLPDELWLSILSLLPLWDLTALVQVCRRLHALATDHTLWNRLRVESSAPTHQWLQTVGQRRPRSLRLKSCSSCSLSSRGLEMFFTLSKNTLEEVGVTDCVGPGLSGDRTLTLVGQLCDHVTHLDVSWSGATDSGLRALSDGPAGLRLTSLLLSGCHITDEPLKTLVMRHKQSLCRLEVFGCHSLTATCLQTVFEMCPGLQHLNIGQLPRANALSLTVMTSHLKHLVSLNLTGLKAVTDALLDTLLQTCVGLQSLNLSCCGGVTDVTLHNISRYTSGIRSLDVGGCKAVTDAGVESLAHGCWRLQQLDLRSTGTGNRGVTLLAKHCSQHLHTVKLSFCRIVPESVLELCRRCVRLKLLHIYGCKPLPTESEIRGVNAAVQVCPLLRPR